MPLRPTGSKQTLKVQLEIKGPMTPQQYEEFLREFQALVDKYHAKVDTVMETRP